MEYICQVSTFEFPCKFFIYIEGNKENKISTVKMTRFKHVNKYLDDINYNISTPPTYDVDDEYCYQYYLTKIVRKEITLI
jgi:hypothetical protein